MITQSTTTTPQRNVFSPLIDKLAVVAEILMKSSHLHRRAEEAQRFFALSDEDLARQGLKREDIMYRVFGPLIHM